MLTNAKYRISRAQQFLLAGLGAIALGLAGCSGSTGSSDPVVPPDPVFPPGPGSGAPIPITSAKSIVASITRVTVGDDGRPVVELFLRDPDFYSLTGLPAGNIYFVLARLEPAVNATSSTWHAITRRTEAFPGSPAPTPSDPEHLTGTGPKNQATTEPATAGTWTENGKGVYTYKFAKSLKGDAGIPYDGSLPHRVGLEIRLNPPIAANNAVYTFTPATNDPVNASGREIIDTATCNSCHDRLAVHGGARFDVPYCVMCHESYSFDAQSGNTIDFKVMIHKIHSGENLPSVAAGGIYGIYGFGNTFTDFSDVAYPQDIRNCTTCHREGNPLTPQGSNWRQTVNIATCTSCHDTINFATGENHGGVAATEDSCSACHGPNSQVAGLSVEHAHQIPVQVAAAKFRYEVLNVANTAPGQTPRVTIRVVDPTNGNAPYDIKAANGPFQNASASLAVDVAYSTRPDFTNTGSGSAAATTGTPAQPIRIDFKANGVADPAYTGGFTATATVAIPATAIGSGIAFLEGHPAVDADGNGTLDTLPVPAAQRAFVITDATAVAYRAIVDLAKCDTCHKQLALHGNNRVGNVQLCASCHNPNATDINRRVAGSNCEAVTGTLDDQSIDFKFMIHAIHSGSASAYKVCGFGNTGIDFSDVVYPGKLSNCEGCHLAGTYYPPDASAALATTFDAGADRSTPAGDVATTPSAAACSACHGDATARQHMQLNSGSFDAVKDASSATPGVPAETCADCHGPGKPTDVKVQHGFGQSQ
jgi:OmcA/MtrC family decaheme c-type cytochrome